MFKEKKTRLGILTIVSALLFSLVGSNFAVQAEGVDNPSNEERDEYAQLAQFYELIDSIPQEIIDSEVDIALTNWLSASTGLALKVEDGIILKSSIQPMGFLGCSSAILGAIAGVGIPFTKIFKLKKAINALGGVSKLVDDMLPLARKYQKKKGLGKVAALKKAISKKASALGKDFMKAIADLAGITLIADQCF